MPRPVPASTASLLASLAIGLALAGGVRADDRAVREGLARLEKVGATRPDLALEGVAQLDAAMRDASPALQREALLHIRRLQRDSGDLAAAQATNARLARLARAQHDNAARAEAMLGDLDDLVGDYQFSAAKALQEQLEREIDLASMPEIRFHALMSFARLRLLNSEYERTLGYLEAAYQLADHLHEPGVARAEASIALAQLYNSSKDQAQALRHLDRAMREDPASFGPRMRCNLYYTRALVLVSLGRLDEAYAAFSRGLEIARGAHIFVMQAHLLGNMADLALRRHQWQEAERVARAALEVSRRIGDRSAELMAKANIGFALGGAGRVAEANVYLDEVIGAFRADANLQALSGMLEEKAAMLERLGQYKDGMAVLREQQGLERKQFNAERANAVATLQEKYAAAENRRRIEQLQEENRLKDATIRNRELKQLALGLLALLALVVGGFAWVLYRRAGKSNRQLRELNAKLEFHAVRDPLTGLFNRRSFVERMHSRTVGANPERRQAAAEPFDLYLILDIDHFKRINDTHGHGVGDAVLVEVARRLERSVRDSDTVLRWGGEEFVIHSATHGEGAALAERVLAAIGATPIQVGALQLEVTASAGLIEVPLAGMEQTALDWERAMALADAALYRAKHGGRNRCCQLVGLHRTDAGPASIEGLDAPAALASMDVHTIHGPASPI